MSIDYKGVGLFLSSLFCCIDGCVYFYASTRLFLLLWASAFIIMALGLTFKSLIHLEFILVCGIRMWSSFIFLHVSVQFSQHHLLRVYCGFISGLSSLFHLSLFLFLCQYHAVLITMAL